MTLSLRFWMSLLLLLLSMTTGCCDDAADSSSLTNQKLRVDDSVEKVPAAADHEYHHEHGDDHSHDDHSHEPRQHGDAGSADPKGGDHGDGKAGGGVDEDEHDHGCRADHHAHDHGHGDQETERRPVDYKTYLAASLAICLIGCCGLLGVAVIPIMQKRIYQHCLQFLIALAVGTLTGDALLHLLPHAMLASSGGEHRHEEHQKTVYIGLIGALSVVGFFFFEKLVNVLGEWRSQRQQHQQVRRDVTVVREGHLPSDKAVGERLCKHKYSSYCVTDFDPEAEKSGADMLANGAQRRMKSGDVDASCQKALLPTVSESAPSTGNGSCGSGTPGMGRRHENRPDHDTVIISQHEVVHHGHSHAHSHIHSAPSSISSVAWMVIFGDGIHNLADGLAIGAAFADGLLSGFSTSVAVLCHELPHEIGDFAMLLKTGMSVRTAIFYNLVSTVLSVLGMLVGLNLGNSAASTAWLFAATAGIFLYVALVDMMPELNSGHAHPLSHEMQHEGQYAAILLQVLGMCVGVGIMALIALYEDDLKSIFKETLD